MAEGVACCRRDDSRGEHSPPHGLLNHAGIQVMPSLFTGVGVLPSMVLREYPLPAPLHRCMGILSPQGVGEAHPPIALGKVLAMQTTHLLQMGFEFLSHSARQHRAPILPALAMAHRDLRALKIKILHP